MLRFFSIRTTPLPLEFPGVHYMDEEEAEAALRVVRSRSLFRYYGVDPQNEVETFESELAAFLGASHAVAVTSGTAALSVALSALGVGPGTGSDYPGLHVGFGGVCGSHARSDSGACGY